MGSPSQSGSVTKVAPKANKWAKPVAKKRGSRPSNRSSSAAEGRKASESRKRMKQRILSLEGRISVIESYLSDARDEKSYIVLDTSKK